MDKPGSPDRFSAPRNWLQDRFTEKSTKKTTRSKLPTANWGLTLTAGNIKLALPHNQCGRYFLHRDREIRGRNETGCDFGVRRFCVVHCNRKCARCGALHKNQPDVIKLFLGEVFREIRFVGVSLAMNLSARDFLDNGP